MDKDNGEPNQEHGLQLGQQLDSQVGSELGAQVGSELGPQVGAQHGSDHSSDDADSLDTYEIEEITRSVNEVSFMPPYKAEKADISLTKFG